MSYIYKSYSKFGSGNLSC